MSKLETRKLSDFQNGELDHIVYMSVGAHTHDDLITDTIPKKTRDLANPKLKFCLWAFSSGIAERVFNLCKQWAKNDCIYAVFTTKYNGEKNKDTKDDIIATSFKSYDKNEAEKIPEGMQDVTYSGTNPSALYVEELYEIEDDGSVFYTSDYDNGDSLKFIRGFGFLNKLKVPKKHRDRYKVLYIAKLKFPFIVKLDPK